MDSLEIKIDAAKKHIHANVDALILQAKSKKAKDVLIAKIRIRNLARGYLKQDEQSASSIWMSLKKQLTK